MAYNWKTGNVVRRFQGHEREITKVIVKLLLLLLLLLLLISFISHGSALFSRGLKNWNLHVRTLPTQQYIGIIIG